MHLRKHLHKTDGLMNHQADGSWRTCPVVRIDLVYMVNAYPKINFKKVWTANSCSPSGNEGCEGQKDTRADEDWCGRLIGRWVFDSAGKPSGWKWPLSNRDLMSFILWISISLSLYTNFSLFDVTFNCSTHQLVTILTVTDPKTSF